MGKALYRKIKWTIENNVYARHKAYSYKYTNTSTRELQN